MASPAIKKPTVFISHAATDEPIVRVLHAEIRRIFANGVDVFATSVPGNLPAGGDWLAKVNEKLQKASAVIVLITPVSLNRPWIWFEVGASWSKMEEGDGRILPVCVPEIDKGDLPEPLSRLQALSLGKAAETKELFQALVDLFDFGSLKGFRHARIKSNLPKYDALPVSERDLSSGTVYNGPYESYSPDELREVLKDEMLNDAWSSRHGQYGSDVFRGELLHFRQVDDHLALPPGTAKKLLPSTATDNYYVDIRQHTENTIRFRVDQAAYEAAFGDEEDE